MPAKPNTQRPPHEVQLIGKRAAKRKRRHHPTAITQRFGHRASGDGDDIEDEPRRRFVTGPGVCSRYDITETSLSRWLADGKLGFPKPTMVVNGRRYWLEADLFTWEMTRIRRDQKAFEVA